jgi:hypothetical protein
VVVLLIDFLFLSKVAISTTEMRKKKKRKEKEIERIARSFLFFDIYMRHDQFFEYLLNHNIAARSSLRSSLLPVSSLLACWTPYYNLSFVKKKTWLKNL